MPLENDALKGGGGIFIEDQVMAVAHRYTQNYCYMYKKAFYAPASPDLGLWPGS